MYGINIEQLGPGIKLLLGLLIGLEIWIVYEIRKRKEKNNAKRRR